MTFTKRDRYHAVSDCGRFTINVARMGSGRCYMAVYRGREIIGTWRCADEPGDRAAAYREAVAACEAHA